MCQDTVRGGGGDIVEWSATPVELQVALLSSMLDFSGIKLSDGQGLKAQLLIDLALLETAVGFLNVGMLEPGV